MADNDQEDDEFTPTPEQAEAYRQRTQATIGLGRFDRFCASLQSSQLQAHKTHPDCIVVSTLGNSMSVVEYDEGKVGIAVPPMHAAWIELFPFDFVCATATEIIFVSRLYKWLNEEVPVMGISLGAMVPSELLAKMCNQEAVQMFMVDNADLANPKNGVLLRDGMPIEVFQAKDEVPLFKTRAHYERIKGETVFDPKSNLHSHFAG